MEVPDCRAPEIAVHPPIRSPIEKQGQEMLNLQDTLLKLKRQILESRASSIKVKLVGNGKMLETSTSQLSVMADTRNELHTMNLADTTSMLSYRIGNPLYKANGTISGSLEKENISTQEELLSSTIALGNNSDGKCSVCCIKLPYVEKVPRYTTWIFLARNQKMAEDQSVVGRRQICYDCHGGETIMCSDSEGELAELEEIKHEFSEGEDRILWKAIYEHGDSSEVYANLKDFIDATTSEIKERYDALMRKWQGDHADDSVHSVVKKSERQLFLERTLDAALDSFDNLFCRRCLVFDCRPHGCSQNLVFSGEQLPFSVDSEDTSKPCSKECYLWRIGQNSSYALSCKEPVKGKKHISMTECGGDPSTVRFGVERVTNQFGKKAEKRKVFESENQNLENSKIAAEESFEITEKKLKNTTLDETVASESSKAKGESPYKIRPCITDASSTKIHTNTYSGSPIVKSASDRSKAQNYSKWNPIEKDLYMKGVEIFGKNSCLITRNLLSGLKTCVEVWDYMFTDGVNISNGSTMTSFGMESDANDSSCMEQEIPSRSRIWRRRGRNRKLKYTWKSTGHPSIRKRIADGKEKCKQYVPCGCQQACGKQCPCIENATCCEKYCGCSKSCKNRFRGCHCAKSQCRSRQCPCFAANRECDPDVCRNCWVSCGDSSVDACPTRGDVYQCGNMKLLLKQQERILLGRSDVAGWGAFIKNPVNKNDYLGEYTGELISHKEADKRGKIYDRANSSFLFDLNDEYVLDAYRKGDKLKFANHSSNPNCYAKVVLVAGDHRVGIFAKDHIDAGEELFYDYRYGPDQAPVWARKPEGSKRDDSSSSHSRRAHKVA